MIIGVPKEIKDNESRIALVPAGAELLVGDGHEVLVEKNGGVGSGIDDREYVDAGATIVVDNEEVFARADMIVKVKEPLEVEYGLCREGQILFTYFHFAAAEALTRGMIESGAVCIAYETIENDRGDLPLLIPMSEVAGRLSVQQGAKYLEKPMLGRGVLLGGVPGVEPAEVVILGGGVVGTEAAKMAAGLGADVTILDLDLNRLRYLDDVMPANVRTLYSTPQAIRRACRKADLVVGAVLLPGAKAPALVTRSILQEMYEGSVIVDVAVDQGGCVETTRPTTHSNPVFIEEGVVHYCVANMPGAVGRTSTFALTNATLPYARQIASMGWQEACRADEGLAKGLNVVAGQVTYDAVGDAFGIESVSPASVL